MDIVAPESSINFPSRLTLATFCIDGTLAFAGPAGTLAQMTWAGASFFALALALAFALSFVLSFALERTSLFSFLRRDHDPLPSFGCLSRWKVTTRSVHVFRELSGVCGGNRVPGLSRVYLRLPRVFRQVDPARQEWVQRKYYRWCHNRRSHDSYRSSRFPLNGVRTHIALCRASQSYRTMVPTDSP